MTDSVQTSYTVDPAIGFEGGLLDLNPREIVSKLVETTTIPAGRVVSRGTDDDQAKLGAAATSAAVTATEAATYLMTAGMTLVVDVDNAGDATATWDAAAATITDTTTYAVTDQDGLTSIVTLTGGPFSGVAQTVTFSGATTTAASVAAQMNAGLAGCSVAVVGGQVKITHDSKGTGMAIAVAAGTGGLTWDTPVAGTGDVVDIAAVTAAEIKTVIEADTTATVALTTSAFTISSPTTGITSELDIDGTSTALTVLGLTAAVTTGAAASSPLGLSVRDIGIAGVGAGSTNAVSYEDTDVVPVLRDGYAYAAIAGTGAPGASLYFTNATGALGIGTASTGQTQLSTWSLESTIATTGDIGKIRVRS